MQGLIINASKVARMLKITHDDIYNEVRRIKKKSKAEANSRPTISPEMFIEGLSANEEASPPPPWLSLPLPS